MRPHKTLLYLEPEQISVLQYSLWILLGVLSVTGLNNQQKPGNIELPWEVGPSFPRGTIAAYATLPRIFPEMHSGKCSSNFMSSTRPFKVNHDCQKHASATLPRILLEKYSGNYSSISRHTAMPSNCKISHDCQKRDLLKSSESITRRTIVSYEKAK